MGGSLCVYGRLHVFCSGLAAAGPRLRPFGGRDCEDQHLAERLRLMAADLAAKANEAEDAPAKRPRQPSRLWRPSTLNVVLPAPRIKEGS